MKILVINGSPKGNYSCTLQTVLYIQKKNPKHEYRFLNAGTGVKRLAQDFTQAAEDIRWADLLLFSYPVYTFLAPSQLHRFIAEMKEQMSEEELSGKYATQITTSKHFYDVTAHTYIQQNCQDMGLKFIKGLSADMDDLPTAKGQKEALAFFEYVNWCVTEDVFESFPEKPVPPKHVKVSIADQGAFAGVSKKDFQEKSSAQVSKKTFQEKSSAQASKKVSNQKTPVQLNQNPTIALVADLAPEDIQLSDMIARFTAVMSANSYEIRLVNIHSFPFKGGCISCFRCAADGNCFYKDGFAEMLREEIQTCDAIVQAFSIQDHSMGPIFKTYDDRQFCNGHRTVTMGMPFGYLISGDYSREVNLQLMIEARAEVGGNFLAGIATDEKDPDGEIDLLTRKLDYAIREGYVQPANYLGVGGRKIFRDLIWLMQGMMKEDHRFFKKHGMYDFPQKRRPTMMAMYLVGAMMTNPGLRKKMGSKMNEGMLMPYKKVLEK